MAACGGLCRVGKFALQRDAAALKLGVRDRHGGEQRLGVGVAWGVIQSMGVGDLHHAAKIHHRDAVGDVFHHREIMGDEEIGEVESLLQVFQEVDDLRLDRDVQR